MWLGIANRWATVLGVLADAYAFVWLFRYAPWLLKLRQGKSAPAPSDTYRVPPAAGSPARSDGEVVHCTACRGLANAVPVLALTVVSLDEWLTVRNPFSPLETVLAVANPVICLLLVVLIVWLERVRRSYRRFAKAAFVGQL